MRTTAWALVALGSLLASAQAGCGRIDYDARALDGGGAQPDAFVTSDAGGPSADAGVREDAGIAEDAGTDAGPPECPSEMAEIVGATARTCIDVAQSGSLTYVDSVAACDAAGKRLCTDAEWFAGCQQLSPAVATDMIDDWEWVSDLVSATVAGKRGGGGACDTTSSHAIDTDPYGYRCCLGL